MPERAVLGDIEFSVVETEEPERENQITEHPVEVGVNVNDHIQPRPLSFAISGVIAGPDASQKYSKLITYKNSGELLTYIGRNLCNSMVIESFSSEHTVKIRDGFSFEITLRQVRIVSPQTAVYVAPDPSTPPPPAQEKAVKSQVKPVENKGTQQPKTHNATGNEVIQKLAVMGWNQLPLLEVG